MRLDIIILNVRTFAIVPSTGISWISFANASLVLTPIVNKIIAAALELNEIALILGMNLNTVKTKLYRGLKTLKVIMEKEESITNCILHYVQRIILIFYITER